MSKAKKIILVFLSILTISTLILSVPVSATTGTVYSMAFQQPQATNYDGYLEVYYRNPNDNSYQVYTYFWTIANLTHSAVEDVVFPRMSISVSSKSISYSYGFHSNNSSDSFKYVLATGFFRSTDGAYLTDYSGTLSTGLPYTNGSFWVPEWLEVVGVKVYGNGYLAGNSISDSNGGSWSVLYGGDNAIYNQLESIKSILLQQSNQDIIDNADKNASQIQSNADKNASQIQSNADKNASETQANDDKNTQAIIDNQNDLAEKEKTETQNQGEGSINDVSGAIEDKSAGFISSIGNLVSAMSYNGTSCAWKFPALKLPAIAGVMSEIKLTDEKPIDFEFWVNKMPSNVLLLVRSLLTIALIVYCFKELYNTISYVLTLKGGGNSE